MSEPTVFQSQVLFANAQKAQADASSNQLEVDKLNELAAIDNRALFSCSAVFPFDLFPDRIIIDRTKISITKKFFFFTRQMQSIMIKDLLTVIVEESLLFATLQIVDRLFPQETIAVTHLKKSDARNARFMLEGLIIGDKEKIDFSKIRNEDLIPQLIEIGRTRTT